MEQQSGMTRRQALTYGGGIALAATATGVATAGAAEAASDGRPLQVLSVSLWQAKQVLQAAERRAREIGVPMYIVVVDNCGIEKAAHRMDGNGQASITLAPLKAQTANAFRQPTHVLAERVAGDPARLASIASAPGFTLLGGGVPITVDGTVIGAVGVGGGSPEQDTDVAEAGVAALG
jgi:glc operon protein GlcG